MPPKRRQRQQEEQAQQPQQQQRNPTATVQVNSAQPPPLRGCLAQILVPVQEIEEAASPAQKSQQDAAQFIAHLTTLLAGGHPACITDVTFVPLKPSSAAAAAGGKRLNRATAAAGAADSIISSEDSGVNLIVVISPQQLIQYQEALKRDQEEGSNKNGKKKPQPKGKKSKSAAASAPVAVPTAQDAKIAQEWDTGRRLELLLPTKVAAEVRSRQLLTVDSRFILELAAMHGILSQTVLSQIVGGGGERTVTRNSTGGGLAAASALLSPPSGINQDDGDHHAADFYSRFVIHDPKFLRGCCVAVTSDATTVTVKQIDQAVKFFGGKFLASYDSPEQMFESVQATLLANKKQQKQHQLILSQNIAGSIELNCEEELRGGESDNNDNCSPPQLAPNDFPIMIFVDSEKNKNGGGVVLQVSPEWLQLCITRGRRVPF